MRSRFPLLAIAAIVALSALGFLTACTACNPSLECGSWVFSGTPRGTAPFEDFPLSSAFTFTPSNCGKNCQCPQDVMIQMASVYDEATHSYKYPTSSYAARATSTGWAIDRIDGEGYGWYGLINDGKTFDPLWNTPGSNGTANTLFDDPGGWPDNIVFYSLDVAVCFSPSPCQNKILGYYFWSWTTDSSGTPSTFIIGPAWQSMETEFQTALSLWNTWAPTSGVEVGTSGISGEPSLPHAVVFPTLSDL